MDGGLAPACLKEPTMPLMTFQIPPLLNRTLDAVQSAAARRRWPADLRRLPPTFVTTDGRKLQLRLIRPTDSPLLAELFYHLSPETRRRRFHHAVEHATPEMVLVESERLADVDNRTVGGAILAIERGPSSERIVGVVRLMRSPKTPRSPEAEAAIVVRDDYHRCGVGKELLYRLVLLARRMKVKTMIADIEADNYAALRAFREIGLPTTSDTTHGETRLFLTVPD
ncbi:MAG: GNAT family N-acetyltransferase [Caldilineaceae bacterium]